MCQEINTVTASENNKNEGNRRNARTSQLFSMFPSKESFNQKFQTICGFKLEDLSTFESFVNLLYRPTDPASLGVCRALFGLCMVLDIVEERGFADIDIKWGDPMDCHFPLIHGMTVPSLPWMVIIYAVMWLGAFGIMLGFYFKTACACFVLPYWYIFSLDKSFWNNHTYLYGIVTTLLWGTEANKYFALDAKKTKQNVEKVALWNYFILKFQFFVLYFLAGLKKSSREWLEGYAMTNLSQHWVFDPFKLFLSVEQTDYLIVHWFGFIFDLTVGFWMLLDRTRIPAMFFCTAFHFMNSRLFHIGMFPYACLATMPLFCHVDWPRKLPHKWNHILLYFISNKNDEQCPLENANGKEILKGSTDEIFADRIKKCPNTTEVGNLNEHGKNFETTSSLMKTQANKDINKKKCQPIKVKKRQKFVVSLLLLHIALQFFLPYSHFITKGYNNWVPGLYGYSWDMMVHAWDTILVVIKVHDNANNVDTYIDPEAWIHNDRWAKHGDMLRQYAFCIKRNLMSQKEQVLNSGRVDKENQQWTELSSNISIYMDVWSSLNGRFQQRMFNPNVDMLTVDWHPFKFPSYVMPLLTQYNSYRNKLDEIQRQVYNWSNYTDVLYVADFPGMFLENYIPVDFINVSLTVLEGEVSLNEEGKKKSMTLKKEDSVSVNTGKFHKVTTISSYPACYMYTYTNNTNKHLNDDGITGGNFDRDHLPIATELKYKIDAWSRVFNHMINTFYYMVYNVPMVRRIRINN